MAVCHSGPPAVTIFKPHLVRLSENLASRPTFPSPLTYSHQHTVFLTIPLPHRFLIIPPPHPRLLLTRFPVINHPPTTLKSPLIRDPAFATIFRSITDLAILARSESLTAGAELQMWWDDGSVTRSAQGRRARASSAGSPKGVEVGTTSLRFVRMCLSDLEFGAVTYREHLCRAEC
jgi:hypothetical protein